MSKPNEGKIPRKGRSVTDQKAFTYAKFLLIHANNPTSAYIAAFPDEPIDRAYGQAIRFSQAPKVKRFVSQLIAKAVIDVPLLDRNIIRGYERIASADIRQVLDAKGKLIPLEHWPDEFCSAVQSVSFSRETGQIIKVNIAPKVPALDGLSRIRNLFAADSLSRDTGNLLAGLPREVVLKLRDRLAKLAEREVKKIAPPAEVVTVELEQATEPEPVTVNANIEGEDDGS